MARFFTPPGFQVELPTGLPAIGYKLLFFVAGTTTPQNVFSDSGLTTLITQPVILDSSGRPTVGGGSQIYLSPATYRVQLKTAADVLVCDWDNVDPGLALGTGALPIASGGTGATTASGARSNLGLGTAAVVNTGTTSGQVPILDANGQLPASIMATLVGFQFLTASSGTYTPTALARNALVIAQAGGGAGSGNPGSSATGGGGGGGETRMYLLTGITGTYSYACGAGGAGVANVAGTNGGDTTFGTGPLVTAKGGSGAAVQAAAIGGSGGTGGTSFPGGNGNAGFSTSNIYGAVGGAPGLGMFYGKTAMATVSGQTAGGFGTGGGGGQNNTIAGQNGAPGAILILEFK